MNQDNPRLGIIMVVFGLCVAAFTGALMKKLSADFSAYQITWFRLLGLCLILLPVVVIKFGKTVLQTARPFMQVIRGLTMASSTVAFVIGAKTIDFADAISILYAYPFLLTVLACVFLKERIGLIGWVGVFGGFCGVLFVMQPDFRNFNTGTLFVFLCAIIVAVQLLLNRALGASSHPLVTSIWGAVVGMAILSFIVPAYWKPINLDQLFWFGLMTICGAINQICLVYAFSKAPASTLAPFTYFEIVASVLIGLLMFGTLPTSLSWVGIALIIVSGLIVAKNLQTQIIPRRSPKI